MRRMEDRAKVVIMQDRAKVVIMQDRDSRVAISRAKGTGSRPFDRLRDR